MDPEAEKQAATFADLVEYREALIMLEEFGPGYNVSFYRYWSSLKWPPAYWVGVSKIRPPEVGLGFDDFSKNCSGSNFLDAVRTLIQTVRAHIATTEALLARPQGVIADVLESRHQAALAARQKAAGTISTDKDAATFANFVEYREAALMLEEFGPRFTISFQRLWPAVYSSPSYKLVVTKFKPSGITGGPDFETEHSGMSLRKVASDARQSVLFRGHP